MTKQQILNHFNNGDVVECLLSQTQGKFNESTLHISQDFWCFIDKETDRLVIIEHNGKLAKTIQPDKTEVYAQLGKEVEVILKAWRNDHEAGGRIRKLYGL